MVVSDGGVCFHRYRLYRGGCSDTDRTLMGIDYAGRLGTGDTVGDLNNDGNKEVVASAPYGDVNGYSGAGRVVSGRCKHIP